MKPTIGPRDLELLVLKAIERVSRTEWVPLTLPGLHNRLVEIDAKANALSSSELVDALQALAEGGFVAIQKHVGGGRPLAYEMAQSLDQFIGHEFFDKGSFEVRLIHEGRKALGVLTISVASSPDELDDRLPLYRPRVFDLDLKTFATQAIQDKHPLSLLLIDLDHFKDVNDRHGHTVGDAVLLGFGHLVAKRIGGKGKAYRYGRGDEVVVLLQNYTEDEAVTLAELIRKDIEGSTLIDRQVRITASFGIAVLPEHTKESKALLELADKALYDAKRLGRNLVRISGEPDFIADRETLPKRRLAQPSTPARLSQKTVAFMVETYTLVCTPLDDDTLPFLSDDALYNGLYELGVRAQILEACKYEHHWQFQLLLPALHDGRFFYEMRRRSVGSALGRAGIEQEGVLSEDLRNGQQVLLRLAQLLTRILPNSEDEPPSDIGLRIHAELVNRLHTDGYALVSGKLVAREGHTLDDIESGI